MVAGIGWRTGVAAWACAAASLLSACGGGGSGGASTASVPSVREVTSGLLPPAVTAGATLADDAAVWRPLIDQAVYRYRGRHSLGTTFPPDTFYDNVVTQVAQAGGIVENSTNAYNEGPDTTANPVKAQAGTISQQVPFQVTAGASPLMLDFVELRSPVRVNDRYVIADRRVDDIGTDVDGDKKNDAMDLAIWVQVAGDDVIDLPYRKAVRTIRTDTTIRVRVVPSGGGTVAIVESRLSVWYAAGLGPVKVRRDSPQANNAGLRQIDEEILVSQESGNSGVGSSPNAQILRTATGSAIPLAENAVRFDNHVVALTSLPDMPSALGFMLTQIDPRGARVASTAYPTSSLVEEAANRRLLRVGNELRLLYTGNDGIRMLSLSADGQSLLARTPTTLVSGPLGSVPYAASNSSRFLAASSGSVIWVVSQPYIDSSTLEQGRLELRRFDAAGKPLGAPMVLESGTAAYRLQSLQMAASAQDLFLLWYRGQPSPGPRYLLIDAATGVSRAPPSATAVDLGPDCAIEGLPLLRDAAALIACGSRADRLVTLGTDGSPLASAAGAVRTDSVLPADWITNQGGLTWTEDPQRLTFFGPRYEKFWPEDNLPSAFIQFGEAALAGSGPDAGSYRTLTRLDYRTLQPQYAFTFGNRILLIGADCLCQGGKLGTLTVWR